MRCSTANKKLIRPAAVVQKTFSKIHPVESYSEYFPDRESHFISKLLDGSSLEKDSSLSILLRFLLSTHGNLNLPSLGNCQVDYSQQYARVLGCHVILVIFDVLVWWVGCRGAITASRQELFVCHCYFARVCVTFERETFVKKGPVRESCQDSMIEQLKRGINKLADCLRSGWQYIMLQQKWLLWCHFGLLNPGVDFTTLHKNAKSK